MALTNLVKEMAASKVSNEMLSEKIGVHRNTIANRLSGVGKFSIEEAFAIQRQFFPTLGIEYLFKQEK